MSDARELLFVYGSLKRGQPNHAELGAAEFVATACTVPRFELRVIDGYPALVPGTRRVRGELYRIATAQLSTLDEFEGAGYCRQTIELECEPTRQVLAYVAVAPNAGVLYSADEWPEP